MSGPLLIMLLLAATVSSGVASSLPGNHPKVIVAQRVLDDLVRAVGDGRTPPALELLPRGQASRHQVLWIDFGQNLLTMQEEVYDICATMGADSLNALAFLLSHELAHRYKDHDWVADFVSGAADLEVGRRLDELNLDRAGMLARETEADDWGGFFSAIAGYPGADVAPAVLGRIYAAYGLPEELAGYPSLTERGQIAVRASDRLRRLVPIYEAGHLLARIRIFEEAARCFDHIAVDFPSREVLSNAGLARVLQALDGFQQDGAVRFVYPFEFDAATRLRRSETKQQSGDEDLLGQFEARRLYYERLQAAADWFEQARARDPAYVPAYVNLAGVMDLQGESDDALFWAGKAIRLARDQQAEVSLAHAYIVRAIAHIHGEPSAPDLARQDFDRARAASPLLVELNLAALEHRDPVGVESPPPVDAAAWTETIDALRPDDVRAVLDDPETVTEVPRSGNQPALDIYTRSRDTGDLLVVEAGYSLYAFISTVPAYDGPTGRGIHVGDGTAQVEAAYGSPSHIVSHTLGVDGVYLHAAIIFRYGAHNRVQGWVLYAVQ